MYAIDLDFAYDDDRETLDEALAYCTRHLDIEHEVVNAEGPAGGWPVVRFTGERARLSRLLQRYCDSTDDALALAAHMQRVD